MTKIKPQLLFSLITFAVFALIYWFTLPPTFVGYADSEELLLAAYNGGLFRPPYYPLYSMLLSLFTHLSLPLSVATKGHLLSLILSATSLALVFYNLLRLYPLNHPKKINRYEQYGLAIFGTLMLGFSSLFWRYSLIAEVFSLSALFLSFLIHLVVTFYETPLKKSLPIKFWLKLSLLTGLMIGHQQILVFCLPLVAYLIYLRRSQIKLKTYFLSAISAVLSFILPFLIHLNLYSSEAQFTWPNNFSFPGFFELLAQGELQFSGRLREFYSHGFSQNTNFDGVINSLRHFLILIIQGFGWWLLPVLLLAIYWLYRIRKPLNLAFGLMALGMLLVLPSFYSWPNDWASQAKLIGRFVPGMVLIPFMVYEATLIMVTRLSTALAILLPRKVTPLLIGCLGLFLLVYQFTVSLPQVNLSQYHLVENRYSSILNSVADQAIVFCFSDTSCFSLMYLQQVESLRPDVTLIPLAYPYALNTINQPDLRGFTYSRQPYLLYDIIAHNLNRRPLYTVEMSDYYVNSLGFDYPYVFFLPMGTFGQLVSQLPESLPEPQTPDAEAWLQQDTSFFDPSRLQHKSATARDLLFNGLWYNRMGDREKMYRQFNLAANLYYQFGATEKRMFDGLRSNLEQNRYEAKYKPGSSLPDANHHLEMVNPLLQDRLVGKAYRAALASFFVEPNNPNVHLALAEVIEQMGHPEEALQEYRHVLMLDPQNEAASKKLSTQVNP